ncbi:MAG: DUF2635 domain-containing protein [Planctomycetota bacterium]
MSAGSTPKTIRVTPAAGRKVRNPDDQYRVVDGEIDVPRTPYWIRRITAGDVTEVSTPESKSKPQRTK